MIAAAALVALASALAVEAAPPAAGEPAIRDIDLSRHFEGLDGCFLMLEAGSGRLTRHNAAQCAKRLSPCSTFKIPNSLIGLETGVIAGADHKMAWDGEKRRLDAWNRDHDLRSAIAGSVVWYYQRLAAEVGEARMREWIHEIGYGNEDISGGITEFWLGSSLLVSAEEQVAFLRKLVRGDLPFSDRSVAIVEEILILDAGAGRVLRAKTGSNARDGKGILGWWVGWVETGSETYIFATNVEGPDGASGITARRVTASIFEELGIP